MAVSIYCHTKKFNLCLLILLSFSCVGIFGQSAHRNISGNIKDINISRPYAKPYSSTHVVTVGDDRVTVDDATNFVPGDTVLLIQMQGVGIMIPDDNSYGGYQTSFGRPGAHEFLLVKSILGTEIVFWNNLKYKSIYDPLGKGNIQLVRVPYFNSATVKAKLYCDSWDGTKGGVLALIIGRSLTLESDIDLTGLGFRGGQNTNPGDGFCQQKTPTTISFFYNSGVYNAGIKGEGNSIHDKDGNVLITSGIVRGQGPNYTGGGGGNGRYSGGGGGANLGSGGLGGNEDYYCEPTYIPGPGGKGGNAANHPSLLPDRIFAGGGGGASTSFTGTGGQGGNGGGIVIIVTDTIISKGGKILVNGNAGADGSATGGAGGGGAGGAIAISLMSYGPEANTLVLSAKGGNGGNNSASFGQGGGGGGGLIYVSKSVAANVSTLCNGGSSDGGTNGSIGEKKEVFAAVLNGFLFNSIRSSVTGTDKDDICSDTPPPPLTGTTPIGGTGPYTYKWEKSYNKTVWTDLGITTKDYTPPAPETLPVVYYRRTITDSSTPTALVDVSKEVEIKVQPFIKGNTIGTNAVICYNQDPVPLVSTGTLIDGNGIYKFEWQSSTDNITFTDPASNNSQSYDPPVLTADAWYRRKVTSGRCVNMSAVVSIDVLPSIVNNNILNTPPDICNGMLFDNLLGSKPATLSGGDNTFEYKWEGNINNTGWVNASGTIDQPDYNPAELAQKVPFNEYHFRRVVYSGPADVCSSTSNEVTFKDFPVITNNIVSSPQTICSGSTPVKLAGSAPANGDGTYKYTWQDSSKVNSGAWTDIPGFINSGSSDYAPAALTDTVSYRRIVNSSACSDISKSVKIVVHKPLTNYAISLLSGSSDTTICNGQDPFRIKGEVSAGGTNLAGDYSYQWKSSTDNATYGNVASATGTGYDPPALTATAYFKRSVTSGACTIESSPVRIGVLPLISGNSFNQDQVICYNTVPAVLSATVTGGDGSFNYLWEQSSDGGATWAPVQGAGNTPGYTPSALTIPMKYRRTVKSGLANCCSVVSNVISIDLHPPLPTGEIVNTADTTIYAGTPVLVGLSLTGTGPWKVTLSENTIDGAATTTSVSAPVISFTPVTSAGISSFTYALSKIVDANGCIATSLSGKKNAIIFDASMYEFPEGFSPNGDAFNNTFQIKGLDLINQEAELSIVNSTGTEVFRTSNFPGQTWTDWDGTNSKGNDLPEGTYYYLLKIRFRLNATVFKTSGFIILKRY